jgi:hypothetical protein
MKWNTNELLDAYRRADFSKRLHLYLQYRDLRPEFMEIERDALRPEVRKSGPRHKCFSVIHAGTLSHLTGRCVKRRFGII